MASAGDVAAAPLRAPAPGRRRTTCAPRASSELAAELRERLRDSVRAHLVADVPVGVLLSGGIDSCALAALAAREAAHARSARSRSASRSGRSTSSSWRGCVAERYGTDHHELVLRPDAVELLPALAEAFDEPFADSSALPTYLVSQLAAGTSRSRSPARAATSCSAATTPTSPTRCAPRVGRARLAPLRPLVERLPSSSAQGAASTTRPSASSGRRTCRRSSATTAGRRSSPPDARGALLDGATRRRSTRSTSTARATPRPRAPTRSPACRTSTSASTSSTTCS